MNYGEIEVANFTSKGNKSVNEDYFYVRQTRMGLLCIVCDGLGGEDGRKAAEITVKKLSDNISSQPANHNPSLVLEDAIMAAHAAVSDLNANADNDVNKSGTTCVTALIREKEAWILNVGNSRCYVIRGSRIAYRTADHSYVADLVRRGQASEEMARTSKYANVLTQAIGISENIKGTINEVRLERGDRIALLTDGVWMRHPEKTLLQVLSCDDSIDDIVTMLSTLPEATHDSTQLRDDATGVIIELPGRENVNYTLPVLFPNNAPESEANEMSGTTEFPEGSENLALSDNGEEVPDTLYEYNINESGEDEKTGFRRYVIWSLAGCLLIAVSIIIYLAVGLNHSKRDLVTSSHSGQTDSLSTVVSSDSVPEFTVPAETMESEAISQANGLMHSGITNNEIPAEQIERTILTTNESDEYTDNETEAPVEDNSTSYEAVRRAGENLKALRDYDPQSISKKDLRTRRQKRLELFTETVTLLKEAIGATENNELKASITEIGAKMTDPMTKNKILKIDEETGCTTRDGVKIIDSFSARLMELLQ